MRHGKKNKEGQSYSKKVVLVGNPNVGKSVIFGAFTGRYATVSNYPGTTVEVSRGVVTLKGEKTLLIDSPGTNTLVPTSEDEVVTRDILINEDISSVLQVIDTKNIRRGLLVTLQLAEMELPVGLSLNMYDEAGEKGFDIDVERLKEIVGTEVVPTIATQRWGLDKLKATPSLSKNLSEIVSYPPQIDKAARAIEELLPTVTRSRRAISLMLVSGDDTMEGWVEKNLDKTTTEKIYTIASELQRRYSEPVGFVINKLRLARVDKIISEVVTMTPVKGGVISEFIGKWSMHPIGGLVILLGVLFVMYEFVGVLGAGYFVDLIETHVFGEYLNPWITRVVEFLSPWTIVEELLVGEYGMVTMALTYAIAIVLPIVSFFFIFFSFLEDSGYLPRLAVMVDKLFKMMGLNGKAVLPMVLGLGCATMATMTTRILETRKERIIVTLLLALGIPCSAQLGVILGMLSAISFTATLIWAGAVVLVLFVVSYLASKVVPGETSDFILEVPPIRMPKLSNILLKTYVRVQWYLKEAVPLFMLGTLILFLLDKFKILTTLEWVASPVIVRFLDLPKEATGAFIIGFLRRDYGAAGLFQMQKAGLLDPTQVVVSLVTITLFVPCIANLFMIAKERGVKSAIYMSVFIFPFALLVGGLLNIALRTLNISL